MPRKELQGVVLSNKMDKTVTVVVTNHLPHSKYEKRMLKTKKFKAHDAANSCQIGDTVRIRECRPLSKLKSWVVVEVIEAGEKESLTV